MVGIVHPGIYWAILPTLGIYWAILPTLVYPPTYTPWVHHHTYHTLCVPRTALGVLSV